MHQSIQINDQDIRHTVHNCFLDMICATTFGVDLNLQEGKHTEFAEAIDNYAVIVARRFFNFYLQVNWIFRWTPIGRLYTKSLNVLHDMTKKVVQHHIKNRQMDSSTTNTSTLMHHVVNLMQDGLFTEKNLYDTVEIMVLAGFETAAVTMLNILLMLAMHPDVQKQCLEEITRVCGPNGDVSGEEIVQLHFVEMVIKVRII